MSQPIKPAKQTKQSQPMRTLTSRTTSEYYTPRLYVGLARKVLGKIDLDPASAEMPQTWIKAKRFYTKEDDGLTKPWSGRVWLNPPFDDTQAWVDRLVDSFKAGKVTAAVLLVNCNLGYKWFDELWEKYPVCHLRQRVSFIRPNGSSKGEAKRPQALFYFGERYTAEQVFRLHMEPYGRVLMPVYKPALFGPHRALEAAWCFGAEACANVRSILPGKNEREDIAHYYGCEWRDIPENEKQQLIGRYAAGWRAEKGTA